MVTKGYRTVPEKGPRALAKMGETGQNGTGNKIQLIDCAMKETPSRCGFIVYLSLRPAKLWRIGAGFFKNN